MTRDEQGECEMEIIDPLPPVVLFLGLGAFVLLTETGITGLEYIVLIALLLAVVFGSVLWVRGKPSHER